MRIIVLLILSLLQGFLVKAQLTIGSIELNGNITGEFARNFSGGLKQGATYYGMEQVSAAVDFEKARLWKGGTFFIHILNVYGNGPTRKFVGDMMYLSNIEAGNYTGFYEFWYAQQVGRFTLLFGQHDMNSEFAGTKYGENFINSSYGVISNILLNVPVSIYPIAAPCVLIKYPVTNHLMFKIASYDGNPGNMQNNKMNLHWHISKNEGFMNILEGQYVNIRHSQHEIETSAGIQMGTYKIGVFYHSGSFFNYADTTRSKKGNYGIYMIADQMIFSKPAKPSEGLAGMVEVGFSPAKFNLIATSFEAGIRYHGLLPFWKTDFIGLAFTYASISQYVLNDYPLRDVSESSIELSYKFQFAKHFTIQPDVQYLTHPGALRSVENALTGLLRLQLSL